MRYAEFHAQGLCTSTGVVETWVVLGIVYLLFMLGESYGKIDQPEEGLSLLAEGLTIAERTGERWATAELHRARGDLLAMVGHDGEAEAAYRDAIDLARRQQARSLELRAAISLARLWRGQGKRESARELLVDRYESFGEGFESPDLTETRALLDAWS